MVMKDNKYHCKLFISGIIFILSLCLESSKSILRCDSDSECPRGGICFKDECARCICPAGQRVTKLYSNGVLSDICSPRHGLMTKVGEQCNLHNKRCPTGSYCNDVNKLCMCQLGLHLNHDRSHCRPGLLGERCDDFSPCDQRMGLTCVSGLCDCMSSFHRATNWTLFVLRRWDYSKVEATEQYCVTRAVGEPCISDIQCGSVEGSGARCGTCGFCECSISGHVPDVLGTKCGPALGFGHACSLISALVCDGQRGLSCGDVCNIYAYDVIDFTCTCSQMHDRVGEECLLKGVGSVCQTDLDCYGIDAGYGFCESGRCQVNRFLPERDYVPFLSSRVCKLPPDVRNTRKRDHHPERVTTSRDKERIGLKGITSSSTQHLFSGVTTIKSSVLRGVDGTQSVGKVVPILKTTLVQPTRLKGGVNENSAAVNHMKKPISTILLCVSIVLYKYYYLR